MTVLILAPEFDPTVDAVVETLAQRQVTVFRTDLRHFPRWLGLDAELRAGRWSGRLWTAYREVELGEVRSIWNRNPSSYVFLLSMTVAEQDFAYREARLGFGGVLASLDVLWANHPNRCADAIFKLGPSGIIEDGWRKVAYTPSPDRRRSGRDRVRVAHRDHPARVRVQSVRGAPDRDRGPVVPDRDSRRHQGRVHGLAIRPFGVDLRVRARAGYRGGRLKTAEVTFKNSTDAAIWPATTLAGGTATTKPASLPRGRRVSNSLAINRTRQA